MYVGRGPYREEMGGSRGIHVKMYMGKCSKISKTCLPK